MSQPILKFIPPQLLKMGWNERVLTFEDFEQCCFDEGIWFYRKKLRYDEGMFFYYYERPVIVLNKTLSAPMMVWTAFHELVHYFLHPPDLQYFTRGTEDKANYEANIIASVALIPKHHLETYTLTELQDEYGWPNELLWIRKEAYERYEI